MKILAFAASNSRQSINGQLVRHACNVLTTEIALDAQIEFLDLNDYEMPIYSIDREKASGIPEAAQAFYNKIGSVDALIISFAEHNGAYTVAFKNVYDWASRINAKVYQGKRLLALSASPGRRGGANVLALATGAAPRFGADLRAQMSVGPFGEVFQDGQLVDAALAKTLRDGLDALVSDTPSTN